MTDGIIPRGLCQCGCGEETPLAKRTNTKIGHKKGQPVRYVNGHNARCGPVDYVVEDRGYITPCWIWQRHIDPEGYGRLTRSAYQGTAHKWYYLTEIGPVEEGMHLDHLCKNRDCVNPDHLEEVTPATNARRSSKAKLTPFQVTEIRLLYAGGQFYQRELAVRYGVSRSAIKHIVTGDGWR